MKKTFMLALAMLWCALLGHAQTRFWVASTAGNWNNPANWGAAATGPGGAGVPTAGMNVSFTSSFGGTCILDIAPTVTNITLSTYAGTIDLNGNTLSNTGAATFTSGTISNSGVATASVALGGTTTIFNGTLFNADVTGSSSIINFNGSVFSGSVNVTKVGATNDNGTGGNTFNGPFTITNTGAGQVQMANTNPDIFNNTVTVNSNGTSAVVLSRVAAGNQYNQNIVINYNSTGTVAFGTTGGTSTLAAGKTITIGTVGGSGCGNLTLARFTIPAAQTLTLTGNNTAILTMGPSTAFGSDLTVTSPGIVLNSCTVQGTTLLTKTGSTDDGQRGGNVFNGPFTLNNNGDADIRFGSNAADPGDQWIGDAVFNNSSGNRIRVGELSAGNVFMGNATFNCLGGGTDVADRIQISRLTGAETTFNGTTILNNAGVTSDMQISYDPGTSTTFNGPVFFNETTTGAADDYIGNDGTVAFNNDITFTNTSTNTIYMSFGSGAVTLGNGAIKIGGGGFATGQLRITNLTQTGSTAQALTLTGTALLRVASSSFNGNVDFRAPQLLLDGATYGGTTNNFEKTGATSNASIGGNTFNGTTTITNSGTGYFLTGNGNPDQFNGPTTFNNTGGYRFYFAYNHPGQTTNFASTLTINSNKTSGGDQWSVFMADVGASAVNIAGDLLINCGGALRSDFRFLNGTGSSATYGGTVTINSTNSFNGTQMFIGNNGTSTYNDNIVVSSINGSTQMLFNNNTTASSTMAATKTISISGAGFVDGVLSLERFTQIGGTPQALNTLSGTASLVIGPNSAFGGNVDFKSPQVYLNGCNYGGTATIEKTGATDNSSLGGNTFASTTIITNTGSGYVLLGNGSPDQFNGTTTFNNTGNYRIYFAYNHAGQATTFAGDVTMNSNKSGGADSWSFFYGEGANTQVTFGGNVTINCSGTLRSDHRFLNGAGSSATYAGTFTINNTNAHPATTLNIGMNGTSAYNGDIVVSNTNGATQMLFNTTTTASSTLAATKTISIGAGGFAGGTLNLPRFTQIGNTSQTMNTFSNGALLIIGPTSQFDGNVDFRAPQVQLNGCTYGGTAYIEKNGATDNTSAGGNSFAGITTITNSGSGQLILGNTNADQFGAATTFNNTGSHRFVFANAHGGQTTTFAGDLTMNSNRSGATDQWSYLVCEGNTTHVTFGGNVTMNWQGSSRSDYRILNGTGTTASYAGALTINMTSTSINTALNMGTVGVSTYNGDITVSNAGGASGIFFNTSGTASSTLAAGKTVLMGAGGFLNGTLSLIRFTQLGSTAMTLNTFSGTALIVVGPTSALGGNVNFRAPQVLLNGCTYGGTAYIEKNGATDNTGTGGDIFQGTTTLVNSGPASFELANTLPEIFNANLTVNNTGTYRIQIGISAANNQFNGTTTINHGGTASAAVNLIIARNAGSSATFNGPLILNCSNGNNTSGIIIGNDGNATINGNITASNTNSGRGIFLAGGAGAVTLANGFTIKDAGAGTFTTGTLQLSRFTQQGGTAQTITLTGTALLNITTSQFNGVLDFKAPQVVTASTTYNANTSLEKTGATDNPSPGANVFNGTATLTDSGSGYLLMGNGAADQFVGAATFNNTGTYRIYLAHNHPGQTTTFSSDLTLNSSKTGADQYAYLVAENGTSRFTVGGTFTINCAGAARSDHRFLNGTGSSAAYNGNVVINMTNSSANTGIFLGASGTSTYGGNISVTNTSGGTASGVFFNSGATAASTLAATKAISIGAGGFANGSLSILRFTQTGSTNQTLALTGTAILLLGPAVSFDGNVDFKAPQVLLNGGNYNGTAVIEKTGASNNDSNGGNVFAGTTTITNSGGGRMRLAATAGDTYTGSVTFVKSGAGAFEPAYTLTNTFAGDLTTNTNAAMTFGISTGVVEFTSGSAQAVNRVGAIIPTMLRMRMNKTAGIVTLNTQINIGLTATFTSGIMNTTATNYLNFNDDATATAANNTSYVNGPVRKTGNDAFTFPVGADNFYRPIGITAPTNVAHFFTAQYFHAAQAFGGKTTWDPSFWTVSACDYWILDRSTTPTPVANVTVTLSWNDAICGGSGYITSLPGLRVARWDAATSKWVNQGNGSTSGSTSNGTINSAGTVNTFSPFALASVTRLNPLPVELTYFDATDLGATVSLDWTTASELNSESFTVQRSQNGLDFEDLTTMDAAGTKTTESKYNFIDEEPYGGLSFYRLKQTDYNGDVTYPGISSVHRAGESAAFHAYPNPAGNEVVHFTQKANITIINSLDQQIGSAEGVNSINVSGLTPGVYIIRNQNGQVIKLVKK